MSHKNFNFYTSQTIIKQVKYPLTLNKMQWQCLEVRLGNYIQENNDEDFVHKCWLSCLASIMQKVQDKLARTKKQVQTIKIESFEYYALKELIQDLPSNDPYYLATISEIIYQLDRHNKKTIE